jgi:hypothetical protein
VAEGAEEVVAAADVVEEVEEVVLLKRRVRKYRLHHGTGLDPPSRRVGGRVRADMDGDTRQAGGDGDAGDVCWQVEVRREINSERGGNVETLRYAQVGEGQVDGVPGGRAGRRGLEGEGGRHEGECVKGRRGLSESQSQRTSAMWAGEMLH